MPGQRVASGSKHSSETKATYIHYLFCPGGNEQTIGFLPASVFLHIRWEQKPPKFSENAAEQQGSEFSVAPHW